MNNESQAEFVPESSLFRRGIEDDFGKDVKKLVTVEDNVFGQAVELWVQRAQKGLGTAPSDLLPLLEGSRLNATNVADAISVAGFIARRVIDGKDVLEDIAVDSIASGFIAPAEKQCLMERLSAVEKTLQSGMLDVEKARSAIHAGFPSLSKLDIHCASLAVFAKETDPEKDEVDKYQPNLSQLTPVAILRMQIRDIQRNSDVTIALRPSELDLVVKQLRLSQRELRALSDRTGNV